MAEDGFELFRGTAARVAEVDFVVVAGILDVESAVVFEGILIHGGNSGRFVVVAAEVKTLDD